MSNIFFSSVDMHLPAQSNKSTKPFLYKIKIVLPSIIYEPLNLTVPPLYFGTGSVTLRPAFLPLLLKKKNLPIV